MFNKRDFTVNKYYIITGQKRLCLKIKLASGNKTVTNLPIKKPTRNNLERINGTSKNNLINTIT